VIMHRIWVDGTEFRWTREQAAATAWNPYRIKSDRRKSEFHPAVERCPSRDDGWGEFACPLGPAVAWRQGRPKDCSASSSNPMMEGP